MKPHFGMQAERQLRLKRQAVLTDRRLGISNKEKTSF